LEEAETLFQQYQLVLEFGASEVGSALHQTTLLTAVALGRRVFLGGVVVRLGADAPLLVPLPLALTLREAIIQLGGQISNDMVGDHLPHIVVGGKPRIRKRPFEVRTVASGWRGGMVPVESEEADGTKAMPLSAVLAAALAINDAFLYIRGEHAGAGHRSVGLSLWNPHPGNEWLVGTKDEPELSFLPSRLWLLGLGHLGQAFIWALGLLPYRRSENLELILQDVDIITPSTESTSILSTAQQTGQRKTRAMAAWAERRGFSTSIHERRFGAGFSRQEDEPAILLCGLDNALGRRALDQAGFDFVVDAGLGSGYQDFRTLRLHTLPASRLAAQIWPQVAQVPHDSLPPAYMRMLDHGVLDRCGVTLLAGKAVGAPFVGAVAATLVVAEVLRLLHGGPCFQLIDIDLQCPEHREVVLQTRDFTHLNPGFFRVAA
jgi:hypothetical protein